jgi:uncharacterized repeat protein (TIGR03803 family)
MAEFLKYPGKHALRCGLVLALLLPAANALAAKFTVIHNFGKGNDGENPFGDMIADADGNLIGTTAYGGANGYGLVFKLSPRGRETRLLVMQPGENGPFAGVTADALGNLYGTTVQGGASDYGTIFKLAPDGTQTIVHNFGSGTDGALAYAGLTLAASGNFFGATFEGGNGNCGGEGCGTIYKLSANGTEKVLYAFLGGADGQLPYAAALVDRADNLFGTTYEGGAGDCGGGCGTVYEFVHGAKTILHAFTGGADGGSPIGKLFADDAGNYYGTTFAGGSTTCSGGCGTVFKIDSNGTVSTIWSFQGGSDGANPSGGVIMDGAGIIYGTTSAGGAANANTIYRIEPNGTEKILYAFTGGADGDAPYAALTMDENGDLFGTAPGGGTYGMGTAFRLKLN